jgi:hypothetical protein
MDLAQLAEIESDAYGTAYLHLTDVKMRLMKNSALDIKFL